MGIDIYCQIALPQSRIMQLLSPSAYLCVHFVVPLARLRIIIKTLLITEYVKSITLL